MNNFLGYILSYAFLALLLLAGELINKPTKSEGIKFLSRKTVHILTCVLWFIMYFFFEEGYHRVILCLSLFVLLLIFKKFFPSISDSEDKFSGALIYAAVGTGLSFLSVLFEELFIPLGITMCALSLGDGFAGVLGSLIKRYRVKLFGDKTLTGTLSAFIFTFVTAVGFSHGFSLDISLTEALIIGVIFAFTELVTPYSVDNLTTSAAVFILSIIAIGCDILEMYAFSLISIPVIAVLIIKKRALTSGGVVAAVAIALSVILSLGDPGFVLLFSFFALTTAADFIKKGKKRELLCDVHERVFGRNARQVLAVGLLPALLAVISLTGIDVFKVAYAALIAESLGDCLASEIGVLSRGKPFDICKFKRVDPGMSGGISLIGSIASVTGILVIALIYRFSPIYIDGSIFAVVAAALLGVLSDSVIGSTLQRKNICTECGRITERSEHCGMPTELSSGISFITNPVVNTISSLITLMLAVLIQLLL